MTDLEHYNYERIALEYDNYLLRELAYTMKKLEEFFETLSEQLAEVLKILSQRDKIKFYDYIYSDYYCYVKKQVVPYHQVYPP